MARIPNWNRFDEVSDTYDQQFLTTRAPAERLVGHAGITDGNRVVEFGCGTGIATRLIAERVGPEGAVLATDIAEKMLAVARKNLGARPNVEFRTVDAMQPNLAHGAYDVACANCVLMGFDDPGAAVEAWSALVRPGGHVAFTAFSSDMPTPFSIVPEGLAMLRRHLGEMPERFPPNALDSADACAQVLQQAGLQQVRVAQEDLGYHYPDFESFWGEWWASLFRLRLQALGADELRQLRHDLEAAMAPAFAGEGLYRPNVTLLVRGTAPG